MEIDTTKQYAIVVRHASPSHARVLDCRRDLQNVQGTVDEIVNTVRRLGSPIQAVYTNGIDRVRDTASSLARIFGVEKISYDDRLEKGQQGFGELLDDLVLASEGNIICVTNEPQIRDFFNRFCRQYFPLFKSHTPCPLLLQRVKDLSNKYYDFVDFQNRFNNEKRLELETEENRAYNLDRELSLTKDESSLVVLQKGLEEIKRHIDKIKRDRNSEGIKNKVILTELETQYRGLEKEVSPGQWDYLLTLLIQKEVTEGMHPCEIVTHGYRS